MSGGHDAHHGGGGHGQQQNTSVFFILGVVFILIVFGISNTPTGGTTTGGSPQPPLTNLQTPTPYTGPTLYQQPPTYNPAIITDPGPVPDKVKFTPQVASIAPWGYGLTFASKISVLRKLLEGTSEQQKLTIKTVNAGQDGQEIEQAAVRLTPHTIQENYMKLITYNQHLTANHVQCYYDEDGGSRHTPDRNVFHPVAIGWNKFRGGAIINHATLSTGTLTLEGYDLFTTQPDETVTPDNGLPCYTQSEFTDHVGLFDMGDNYQYYDGSDTNQWSAGEFCSQAALSAYDECMAQPPKPDPKNPGKYIQPDCDLKCSGDAHTVFSTRLPDADNVNIFTGKGANDEKEGFTLTNLPNIFDFPNMNGTNLQEHTLEIPLCPGCNVTSDEAIYYLEARRRIYMKAFNCSLTPAILQDPNNPCPTPPPPQEEEDFECPIDIVEKMKPKDTACNLCNISKLKDYLTDFEEKAIPLSPLAIKVLQAAADTYHVPAALLVATMLGEGSFAHPDTWTWSSDENVRKYSDCKVKKPMPRCDEFGHPQTGAKGPFGFIDNWWNNYMEKGGPYKAFENNPEYKEAFANVNSDNFSSCNFVDAAFTSARELGEDQSHLYVPGIPLQCPAMAGYTGTPVYQGGDIPQSCSTWGSDRVALARLQYGNRVCADDTLRTVAIYKAIRCGGK